MDFWFNSQIRQYRLQFVRAFSNFSVMFGANGPNPQLRRVPCRYGESTRIAATVVRGNSENVVLSCPFISCYITGFSMNPGRRQDPTFVEKTQVNERYYDEQKQAYTRQIGNRYTIEKYMPVPFDLTFDVAIWTDNIDIKEQLLEQILVLYNPQINFQTSNNSLDWTMLTVIELMDNVTWTSASIPQGTDTPIDISTLQFKVPIWLNPPAKVKTQKLIQEIVTNIIEGSKDANDMEWTAYEFLTQNVTTPGNSGITTTAISPGQYAFSLTSNNSPVDTAKQPTMVFSKINPTLVASTAFTFNGITINILSSDIDQFVINTNIALADTQLNCARYGDQIQFVNNTGGDITLVDGSGSPLAGMGLQTYVYPGGNLNWWTLIQAYGQLKPYSIYGSSASRINIVTGLPLGSTSVLASGWIDWDSLNQNVLNFYLDVTSLPLADINPITAIIDPMKIGPGAGLVSAAIGQRYLIINDIGPNPNPTTWGTLTAKENDIIEYNGSQWNVSFDATTATGTHYAKNLFDGSLLEYNQGWAPYIPKTLNPGEWNFKF